MSSQLENFVLQFKAYYFETEDGAKYEEVFAENLAGFSRGELFYGLFRFTYSNVGAKLVRSLPVFLTSLTYSDILQGLKKMEEDRLALYHALPFLSEIYALNTTETARDDLFSTSGSALIKSMNPVCQPSVESFEILEKQGLNQFVMINDWKNQGAPIHFEAVEKLRKELRQKSSKILPLKEITVQELLKKSPDFVLEFLTTYSPGEDEFNWLGLAECAATNIHLNGGSNSPDLKWAKISLFAYHKLIQLFPEGAERFLHSEMYIRLGLIKKLGPDPEQPLLQLTPFQNWILTGKFASLTQINGLAENWPKQPISIIRKLRYLKTRLKILGKLEEYGTLELSDSDKAWLALIPHLP